MAIEKCSTDNQECWGFFKLKNVCVCPYVSCTLCTECCPSAVVQRFILPSSQLGRDAPEHITGRGTGHFHSTYYLRFGVKRLKMNGGTSATKVVPWSRPSLSFPGGMGWDLAPSPSSHQQGQGVISAPHIPAVQCAGSCCQRSSPEGPLGIKICPHLSTILHRSYMDSISLLRLGSSLQLHTLFCPKPTETSPGYGNKCPKQCISKNSLSLGEG